MDAPAAATDTRSRILQAAAQVFLEQSFEGATIRDICNRAGANVAAVNYHFGSKEALHAAALEDVMHTCHQSYPMEEGLDPSLPPETLLRRIIINMLRMDFPDDPALARFSKLVWMEVINPKPEFGRLVDRFMRPIKDTLEIILGAIIGPCDQETLRHCVGAVVGQILFHAQNQEIITRIYPDKTYHPDDVRRLAEFIYDFSLGGLYAIRDSLRRQS